MMVLIWSHIVLVRSKQACQFFGKADVGLDPNACHELTCLGCHFLFLTMRPPPEMIFLYRPNNSTATSSAFVDTKHKLTAKNSICYSNTTLSRPNVQNTRAKKLSLDPVLPACALDPPPGHPQALLITGRSRAHAIMQKLARTLPL